MSGNQELICTDNLYYLIINQLIMTHTPGPWAIDNLRIWASGQEEYTIAIIPMDGYSPHQMQANARLIAAAPDLLEALGILVKEIDILVEDGTLAAFALAHPSYKNAREAINKAKGL
jgi:hypothetical protein